MRNLDSLIADIDALETDDELRPLPGDGEARDEFKARMLAEFDALNAEEEDGGEVTIAPWDAWRWTPEPEPEPVPDSAGPPSYVIDPDDIGSVMPRGGPLTTWIGGRRLGTLNAAAA